MWSRTGKTTLGSPRMPPIHSEAVRRGVAGAVRLSRLAGRGFGRILWRRRLLVLACLVVVLALTTLHVATLTPMFEAATLVAVVDHPADSEPGSGADASSEAALEARLEALRTRLAESEAAGGLEAFERKAEADRELLRRYTERAERLASAPQAGQPDAHILAPAVAPKEAKYPRLALIYGAALGGALVLGGLLALGMEAFKRAHA
jgi:uncharacterized protein involved in exopolysaccharide biosynthesis